jgi:hypothetical protein
MKTPNNLQEAVEVLKEELPKNDLEYIQNFKNADETCRLHHSLGMWIRNNWGLWKEDSELHKYFKELQLFHADDMSGIILECLWKDLNNVPYKVEEQIKMYLDYWENKKVG